MKQLMTLLLPKLLFRLPIRPLIYFIAKPILPHFFSYGLQSW